MRIQSYSGAESSSYSSSSSYSVGTVLTKPCTFELRMLYYNTLLLHKIDKIKMTGTSREISSLMTSAASNYNTRLDSSVRIKTRIQYAPKSHKIEYVPMHTIQEIARLATMLAGLIAPRLRFPASIVARRAITLIVRLGT